MGPPFLFLSFHPRVRQIQPQSPTTCHGFVRLQGESAGSSFPGKERYPKKNPFFLGYLSQMWVGGVADSQTRSKPLKTPQNCLFPPKFHLSFSKISQKPWGGPC